MIIDKKVPKKFKKQILKSLKNYELISLSFNANEKAKSINSVNLLLNKLLKKFKQIRFNNWYWRWNNWGLKWFRCKYI